MQHLGSSSLSDGLSNQAWQAIAPNCRHLQHPRSVTDMASGRAAVSPAAPIATTGYSALKCQPQIKRYCNCPVALPYPRPCNLSAPALGAVFLNDHNTSYLPWIFQAPDVAFTHKT